MKEKKDKEMEKLKKDHGLKQKESINTNQEEISMKTETHKVPNLSHSKGKPTETNAAPKRRRTKKRNPRQRSELEIKTNQNLHEREKEERNGTGGTDQGGNKRRFQKKILANKNGPFYLFQGIAESERQDIGKL